MTGTINGTRYFNLLMANGITGAELDTEWASAGSLGAFLYLWNRSQYRNQLTGNYTAYNILEDSDYFQDNVNKTNGYTMGSTELDGLRFGDETYVNHGSGFTGLSNSNAGTVGSKQSALFLRSLTKMYKFNYINKAYYEETNATFGGSNGYHFTCSDQVNGYFLGGTSSLRDMDIWNYASNTDSTDSNILAVGGYRGASAENNTHAYFFGGHLSSGSSSTEIQGMVKATKASVNPAAVLATGCLDPTASETATNMYIFGGTSSDTDRIEKFNISGESISAVSDTLTNAKRTSSFRNNDYDIYLMGSFGSSETEIEKFEGVTDTISTLSAVMSASSDSRESVGLAGGGFS